MALPKKYSNQYLSSEGVVMETEPNGEVVIKQVPQTPNELPTVSGTDNGKVLKVVEGAWAAATAPAGGGILPISVVQDGDNVSLNKTWNEIDAAIRSGILPALLVAVSETNTQIDYIAGTSYYEGGYYSVSLLSGLYQFLTDDPDGYPELPGDNDDPGTPTT